MNKEITVTDFLNMIARHEIGDTKFKYKGGYFAYDSSNNQIVWYYDSNYNSVILPNFSPFEINSLNESVWLIDKS